MYHDPYGDLLETSFSNLRKYIDSIMFPVLEIQSLIAETAEICTKIMQLLREEIVKFVEYIKEIIRQPQIAFTIPYPTSENESYPASITLDNTSQRSPPSRTFKEKAQTKFIFYELKYGKYAYMFVKMILANELYTTARNVFQIFFGF